MDDPNAEAAALFWEQARQQLAQQSADLDTLRTRALAMLSVADLAGYWAQRRRKVTPPLDDYTVRLLTRQDGRCSLCGKNLLTPDQPPQTPQGWEQWFLWVTRQAVPGGFARGNYRSPGRPRPPARSRRLAPVARAR